MTSVNEESAYKSVNVHPLANLHNLDVVQVLTAAAGSQPARLEQPRGQPARRRAAEHRKRGRRSSWPRRERADERPGASPASARAHRGARRWSVVFFQIGVVSEVPVFGVNVDLSPLLVAFVGLLCGSTVGAVTGFAVGLLVDLALVQTLGVTSLIFTLDRLLVRAPARAARPAGGADAAAGRRRGHGRCAGRLLADRVHARRRRAGQPGAAAPDRARRASSTRSSRCRCGRSCAAA